MKLILIIKHIHYYSKSFEENQQVKKSDKNYDTLSKKLKSLKKLSLVMYHLIEKFEMKVEILWQI